MIAARNPDLISIWTTFSLLVIVETYFPCLWGQQKKFGPLRERNVLVFIYWKWCPISLSNSQLFTKKCGVGTFQFRSKSNLYKLIKTNTCIFRSTRWNFWVEQHDCNLWHFQWNQTERNEFWWDIFRGQFRFSKPFGSVFAYSVKTGLLTSKLQRRKLHHKSESGNQRHFSFSWSSLDPNEMVWDGKWFGGRWKWNYLFTQRSEYQNR